MNIFISYAREDAGSAKRLYKQLGQESGIEPWLDSEQLLPGVDWNDEIMSAMQRSHLAILLLSTNSVSKQGYVQKEMREALDRMDSFPPGRIFVIPARLEDCSPNHQQLKKLHRVDLFPDWNDGYSKILRTIERERPAPANIRTSEILEIPAIETLYSRGIVEQRVASRRTLRGADMMNLDLSGLDFSGLDLSGSSLVGCRLTGCRFESATLRGANLERANLTASKFANADLWGVNFWRSNIRDIAGMESANIDYCNFWGTAGITDELERIISKNPHIQSLPDYGSFVVYFTGVHKMSNEQLSSIFIWLNHHYFRSMFIGPATTRRIR